MAEYAFEKISLSLSNNEHTIQRKPVYGMPGCWSSDEPHNSKSLPTLETGFQGIFVCLKGPAAVSESCAKSLLTALLLEEPHHSVY